MDNFNQFWNSFEKTAEVAEAPQDDTADCLKCTMLSYCLNKDDCWMTGESCEGHKYGPPHKGPICGSSCSPHCTKSGHY